MKKLYLYNNQLNSLPVEIGNLINLQYLDLVNNQLNSLPVEIGNLINLQYLDLDNNQLNSLPIELLKIKSLLHINETSYDINNLNINSKILIFSNLNNKISNLPINLKQIWLRNTIKKYNIKVSFNCKIMFYEY